MERKVCPNDGHRLYPVSLHGKILKEDKSRKKEDGSHPIIPANGFVTFLTCRYCGYKERKATPNSLLAKTVELAKQRADERKKLELHTSKKEEVQVVNSPIVAEGTPTADELRH